MIEISIQKDEDYNDSSKFFAIDKGDVEIFHDTKDGKDIVRVTIDGKIEFEYDVNKPDYEIVGRFTSGEAVKRNQLKHSLELLRLKQEYDTAVLKATQNAEKETLINTYRYL